MNKLYTTVRKKIFKGKIAPVGTLFLHIRCKEGKMKYTNTRHIIGGQSDVEIDKIAKEMYDELEQKYPGRMFLTRGRYEHNDIKHIIGLCDFFVGSRMHACIAALSQSIPTVGIAYSKKFHGVFESIGVESSVADACRCEKDELLSIVETAFKKREQTRVHLNKIIPETKAKILNMLEAGNTQ